MKNIINKNRIYTQTLPQAKQLFKLKTGRDWSDKHPFVSGISIFELKAKRTPTRRFFVGTTAAWLNL